MQRYGHLRLQRTNIYVVHSRILKFKEAKINVNHSITKADAQEKRSFLTRIA